MVAKPKKKLSDNKSQIAERLKKAREALALTQQQVADRARVSRSAVVHYEQGNVIPGGPELIGLAKALKITPNYILSGSDAFFDSPSPEHALVTSDERTRMVRLAICMSELERDVAESISAMAMTMLKATLPPDRYATVMAAITQVSDVVDEMMPEMERTADKTIKDMGGKKAIKAKRKSKK